jgi:FAD/FMN-containing dehydrogenase
VGLRSNLLALSADGLRQLWFNEGKESAILQEYFIPAARFQEFTDGLREVRAKHGDLVAATLRDVPEDTESALPFAKCHAIAFVLYHNQELSEEGYKKSGELTRDLIDLAARCGGTFYLPYQLHYTPEQLRRAYPEVDAFFATKRKYDPHGVFSNAWFEKYATRA